MTMRRYLLYSVATTLIALIVRPAWSQAQEAAPSEPVSPSYDVNLPVVIDGQIAGTLLVRLSATQLTSVEANSWQEIAYEHFDAAKVDIVLAAQIDGYVPESAFAASGITLEFDAASLTIRLLATDEARVTRLVSLRPDVMDYSDLSAYETPRASAYVNVFGSQEVRWAADDSAVNEIARQLSLEGAVRPFGTNGPAIEGAVFSDTNVQDGDFRRGEFRIVHDDVARAIRYSAGDVSFRATEFQGSPPCLGCLSNVHLIRSSPSEPSARPASAVSFCSNHPAWMCSSTEYLTDRSGSIRDAMTCRILPSIRA